jgi:hypothetical protein
MILSEGVVAAVATEVLLIAYMLQTVSAVIAVVAAMIAILRIVFSLQEVVGLWWIVPELRQRATQHHASHERVFRKWRSRAVL